MEFPDAILCSACSNSDHGASGYRVGIARLQQHAEPVRLRRLLRTPAAASHAGNAFEVFRRGGSRPLGFTSYHREQDRARTEAAARAQCRSPYVISRGPNDGVMMHLADQRQPSELRLKGSPTGKNYIGPPGEAGWRKIARSSRSTAGC